MWTLAWALDILSLAFLTAAALAFRRQRTAVLVVCGAMFVPTAGAASVAIYWPLSPLLTVLLLGVTLGASLAALLLYWIDRVFAVFCLEMTYLATICWVLWPLLVVANSAALPFL